MLKRLKMISLIFIACIFVIASVIYVVMLTDTNSVKKDFEDLVNGVSQQNIDYGKLVRYDSVRYSEKFSRATVEIKREFVMHNFKEGYINVRYTIERFDDKGEHIYGSCDIPSKWYIKKNDGRWQVVKIEEAP